MNIEISPELTIRIHVSGYSSDIASKEYVDAKFEKFDSDKLDINQGVNNAWALMCVGADGKIMPLALGAGLEIRDGVLVVTATGTITAEITVDEAGNAVITGAELTVDKDGNATITGAVLTVDEAGNAALD